ncbi:MAG: hypothetical protein INR65_09630 [Gluconacetobacter diazotrophicus]|nr:hypothetical protein [Gluconacetobacter diazotrophicus]
MPQSPIVRAVGAVSVLALPMLLATLPASAAPRQPGSGQLYRAAVRCAAIETPVPGGWDEVTSQMRTAGSAFRHGASRYGAAVGRSPDQIADDIEAERNDVSIRYGRSFDDIGWQEDNMADLRAQCSRIVGLM